MFGSVESGHESCYKLQCLRKMGQNSKRTFLQISLLLLMSIMFDSYCSGYFADMRILNHLHPLHPVHLVFKKIMLLMQCH